MPSTVENFPRKNDRTFHQRCLSRARDEPAETPLAPARLNTTWQAGARFVYLFAEHGNGVSLMIVDHLKHLTITPNKNVSLQRKPSPYLSSGASSVILQVLITQIFKLKNPILLPLRPTGRHIVNNALPTDICETISDWLPRNRMTNDKGVCLIMWQGNHAPRAPWT